MSAMASQMPEKFGGQREQVFYFNGKGFKGKLGEVLTLFCKAGRFTVWQKLDDLSFDT